MLTVKKNSRRANARPGNANALKHGAYARRMRLSSDIVQDARRLKLSDELNILRAANLIAATKMGELTQRLHDAEPNIHDDITSRIAAAQNGIYRNITRIESLERTLSGLQVDAANITRIQAATEKLRAEIANITGNRGDTDALSAFFSDLIAEENRSSRDECPLNTD